MSRVLISILSLVLATPFIAQAQTCKTDSIPATTPSSRFKINTDGTVSDTKTGLMWKRCPEGLSGSNCETGSTQSYNWQQALKQAQTVNQTGFAGYKDWRLPNVKELTSIVERQCVDPAINTAIFPKTESWFWSSSPSAGNSDYAWYVYFYNGYAYGNNKSSYGFVRLVRG